MRPNVWLLPQLWMDLLTWAMSVYQQTAQATVDTSVDSSAAQVIQVGRPLKHVARPRFTSFPRSTSSFAGCLACCFACCLASHVHHTLICVEVHLRKGAVRLPIFWHSVSEHFALVGDLVLKMTSEGSRVSFEEIAMPNGSLRRVSVSPESAQNRLLCEQLSFRAKVLSEKQVVQGIRISVYQAEVVKIHRFNLRITLQDILELSDMMQSMAQMEAESVEPQEEIRARDPLSLEQPQKMTVDMSIELDGVHLQVLAPRPVLDFSLGCPLTRLNFNWARGNTPMGSANVERLWLRLQVLNERLAAWEPMLGTSEWNLEFLCRRRHELPQAEAELHCEPVGPVQLAVTLPMIHACSKLLQSYQDAVVKAQEAQHKRSESLEPETEVKKFEDAVLALNLSGLDCQACRGMDLQAFLDTEKAAAKAIRLTSKPTSLDAIVGGKVSLQLKGADTKSLEIKAGVTTIWETSQGRLLVQVLIPRPPQLLLLISSPLLLVNRTLLDLEVKLSNVPELQMEANEWPPFCIPIQFLEEQGHVTAWKGELDATAHLSLPSGFCLALPPGALKKQAAFQLRPAPASVGGIHFSYGAPLHASSAMESEGFAAYSRSVCPDFNLPAYGLRLSGSKTQELYKLCIQAPFSLCNACPVDLSYHLCWSDAGLWTPRVLQEGKDRCEPDGMLHIFDGYGGVWHVPPNGSAFVAPLRLSQGRFEWQQGGRKGHRECPLETNLVKVKRDGQKMSWHFCDAGRGLLKQQPMSLAPGDEIPIYELPEQTSAATLGGALRPALHRNEESLPPLLLSVCLAKDRGSSPWCPPLPVLVEGLLSTVPIDLGPDLRLQCDRQASAGGQCKATIYANCWFHNATGLEVLLVRGSRCPPVFNHLAVMDDAAWAHVDEEHDNDCFKVVKLGSNSGVRLPFVGIGQSAKLSLSSLHDCIVKSDSISASSAHGVGSTLFSLIPAYLAFNMLEYEIGVRQEGSQEVTWLEPHTGRSAIYWSTNGRKRLQVALRTGARCGDWSFAFEISEHYIGCFPIRLSDGSQDRLFCVQIQQCASQLVTLSLAGLEACHQLLNRHPCLVVDACFLDGSDDSHFVAVHGSKVPFAFSGLRHFNTRHGVRLVFGDVSSRKSTSVELPLDRPLSKAIDFEYPISIRVDIVQRVAHITIAPVGFLVGGLDESNALAWTIESNVRIPALDIGIKGSGADSEVFACHLRGLNLQIRQTDELRDTTCELEALQVDYATVRRKKPRTDRSVILASLTQPQPWRLKIVRQQLSESDVILRSIALEFFPSRENEGMVMESNISEELIKELKDFVREATPSQLEGLCLFEVARWAGQPYHKTLSLPPAAARKYVLHDFQCGELKIGVWCKLSYSSLPSFVGAMLTLSSFSATLDVDGARVKLDRQRLFTRQAPFEGSLEALANLVVERYKPCVRHSWRSLINNSNAVLGGLFSRHLWNPRQASKTVPMASVLCVRNGAVNLRAEAPQPRNEPLEVQLDEKGFQQALRSKDRQAMQHFLRQDVQERARLHNN